LDFKNPQKPFLALKNKFCGLFIMRLYAPFSLSFIKNPAFEK